MTQIIHQLVDGSANAPSWHAQHDLLVQGLESVYCGNYRTALALFQKIPIAARGDMTLMSGNLLAEAMRTGNATGVASKKRYGSAQTRILEELMHLCRRLVGRERAANALVPPESYTDLLARQLPPLPAADTGCDDACAGSTTSDVMSSCPFVPMTRQNSSTLAAHLCGHTRTMRVEGLRGCEYYLPLCAYSDGVQRRLLESEVVMSMTGSVSQADELPLLPSCLASMDAEMMKGFVVPFDSPYLLQTEDIVVDEPNCTALIIAGLVAYPTVASFHGVFSLQFSSAIKYRHIFCCMAALGSLDAEGYAHARITRDDIVLLPEGATKMKALRGSAADLLSCFNLPLNYYSSPEEAAGEYPTIFSNVYSLCVLAIEFMTRALPYRWTAVAAADRTRSEAVALQEQCGPEFAAALVGGLIEVVPIPDELGIHPTIKRIFELCLQRDASLRPRPRDVLRMFRSDPHLSDIVSLFPRGPWEQCQPSASAHA